MVKTKTFTRRRKYSLNTSKNKQLKFKKGTKVSKFESDKYLTKEFIGSAIMECFLNNDPQGIVELVGYSEGKNDN